MADALNICLVSPYALAGGHPVAEYVRNEATGLAGRGHRVTVLAPSASSQSLRSGRRRLRSLAAGDAEALHALPGEPLAVAVGPAVPSGARGRGRGAGLPIAASANVALAVGEGGFDIVHAHEPTVPGLATAALRHTRGLIVATFHAETERALSYPIRSGRRKRYGSRIDALLAASTRAAELAATLYPGDYEVMPDPISPHLHPCRQDRHQGRGRVDGRGPRRRPQPDPHRRRHARRGADAGLGPARPQADAALRAAAGARARAHRGAGARRTASPAAGSRRRVRGGAGWEPAPGLGGSRQRRGRGLGRRRPGPALRGRPAAAGRRRGGPPAGADRAARRSWPPRAHGPPASAARRRWPSGWSRSTPACCGGAGHGPRRRRRGRC